MPKAHLTQFLSDGPANVTLTTTAETVVCTLVPISTSGPSTQVILEGAAQITAGTSTTGVQLRVRRGGLTGTQVGATSQTAGDARTQLQASIQVDDFPGDVANQVYVLTAQQVAATGNGTSVSANLSASLNG